MLSAATEVGWAQPGIEGGLHVASGIRLARRDHGRCRRYPECHLRLHPDPQQHPRRARSAFQQVVNSFAGMSFDIAKDKNLTDLYVRAGRDFASLTEVEHAQYSFMLLSFLRRAESVFFQTEMRMLYTEHWPGMRNGIKAIMAAPGAQACWSEIKNRLNPEFRAFIDGLIAEQAQAS